MYTPLSAPMPVTAIIQRTENSQGIHHVVQHLSRYPFIKEILVYNSLATLEQEDLMNNAQWINSSRFTACQETLCYFQNDLWLNPYMDTLYTLAWRFPHQWIANTRLSDYISFMKWRFKRNESLSGYADLGYGVFVPKELILLDAVNDTQFVMRLNQLPYIVANPLLPFEKDPESDQDETREQVYNAVLSQEKAITKEKVDMDVRSSCANDQCLFISNMDMMPPPLEFDEALYPNMTSFETELHQRYRLPAQNSMLYHSYHQAVDQDTETCWDSFQSPKEGDYFGLYMVGDIRAKRVILYTSQNLKDKLSISIQSQLYGPWIDCVTRSHATNQRIQFNLDCPTQFIKSLRLTFTSPFAERLELCGIGLDNFVV